MDMKTVSSQQSAGAVVPTADGQLPTAPAGLAHLIRKPKKPLRVKVVTEGSAAGTRVVDADTGDVLAFDGHMKMDLECSGQGGRATITLTFPNVPVETIGDVKPFNLIGHSTDARPGAPPAAPEPEPPRASDPRGVLAEKARQKLAQQQAKRRR